MTNLPTDRLDALVAAARADFGLPGVAAGVVADDDLAWFSGQGWADLDTRAAPTERSLSRVASVTKTFTATAVLQLRDRGHLALDDPLERHLPEFRAVREVGGRRSDVTIRRLLTHRSGLVTESPPTTWDGPSGPDFPTTDEILAALPETAVVIPADSAMKYSNLAFALLGEVVARLSGRRYVDHVQTEIFDPLGMADLCYEPEAGHAALLMRGYSPGDHSDRPTLAPVASLEGLTSAGQLHANVRDLATWVAFQIRGDGRSRDGQQVLSAASHEESFRPQYAEQDLATGQCLAWRVNRLGELVFHNHGGSVHGFNSSVGFHRLSRLGVVVLANLWPTTAAAELAFALLQVAVGSQAALGGGRGRTRHVGWPVGLSAPSVAFRASAPVQPPPAVPQSLRPLLGRYRAEPGILMDVEWRAGELSFVAPTGGYALHAPATLAPISGDDQRFTVRTGRGAGEEVAFTINPGGTAAFELGGFHYRRS